MSTSENRLRVAFDELGCDNTAFSALSGISMTRLSSAFRGSRDFSHNEMERLNTLVEDMRHLVNDAQPFPVNFKDTQRILSVLQCRRNGVVWKACAFEDQ